MAERQLSLTKATADNLSYRFSRQSAESVNLMTAIYPYLAESSLSDYEEYAAISKQVNSKDLSLYIPRIFVPDSKTYSSQYDIFFPLSQMKNYSGLSEYYGIVGINWVKPEKIRFGTGTTASMIGCVFTMNKMDDYSTTSGSVVLYYPVENIVKAFREISDKNDIMLVDSTGIVMIGTNEDQTLTENEIELITEYDSGSKIISNQIFSFCRLQNMDWYLTIRSKGSSISMGNPFTLIPLLISFIMFIALIIAISVTYNNKQMDKALMKSIEASYKQKLELSEYQMQALQEQIKPHFLYNSLDIIRWMIADGKNSDAAETITSLSKYLRMSISRTTSIVPLSEEIELAEIYVDLIKKRSETQFNLVIDTADNTLNCKVPRFILQPILENSIIHGIFYCKKPNLELRIRSWIDEGKLIIEIEDNGNGMSKEKLDSIFDENNTELGHGYGLKNTRKRLTVFNGPDTVFEIHSKENIGTCVSIEITASNK